MTGSEGKRIMDHHMRKHETAEAHERLRRQDVTQGFRDVRGSIRDLWFFALATSAVIVGIIVFLAAS